MKAKFLLVSCFSLWGTAAFAQQDLSKSYDDASKMKIRAVAETGFIAVLAHKIQLGEDGTYFNYVRDGGQDVLFPASRLSLEVDDKKRNTFIFLYQPLRIETESVLRDDLIANGILFPGSSGIKSLYNFPFYRFFGYFCN